MSNLYSHQGSAPAPLPLLRGTQTAFIVLPDGTVRAGAETLTAGELSAAGYSGPITEPEHDPATEALEWVDGEWTVVYHPLAECKAAVKAKITEEFRRRRDAGTTVILGGNPVTVSTTHDAAFELSRAEAKINRTNPAGTIAVVTRSGVRVTLTGVIAPAMLEAIEDHVAACQENESSLYGEVDEAETPAEVAAIDISTGWP